MFDIQTKKHTSTKQLAQICNIFLRRDFNASEFINHFSLLLVCLLSSSAWASNPKPINGPPAVDDGYVFKAYAAGDASNLSNPVDRLNPSIRVTRDDQHISSILCLIEPLKLYPSTFNRLQMICQKQRGSMAVSGFQDPSLPYLIAPRLGEVREPLTVRWNPVAGVRNYKIWLLRPGGQALWEGNSKASSITLPKGLNLKPGESYRISVEADNGTSSRMEPCSDRLIFSVLTQEEVLKLNSNLAKIRSKRKLESTAQSLVMEEAMQLALFGRSLYSEAIDFLKPHENQKQTLEGQLFLGELSSSLGLNQQAERYFNQAARIAGQAGNEQVVREASRKRDLARHFSCRGRLNECEALGQKAPTCPEP